jgi:ABC-type cobalamin/Fe3+-siderophores transport system ATPase subunit
MSTGCIIVGYQGIGKSTISGYDGFIDLESGNFWIEGKRHEEWYKPYCAIAYHLAKQGYNVFTSSHKVVRDELKQYTDVEKYIVFPDISLKERWIERLEKRYKETKLEKDYKALMNAKEMFDENITDLSQEKEFDAVVLQSMEYDLRSVIYDVIYLKRFLKVLSELR